MAVEGDAKYVCVWIYIFSLADLGSCAAREWRRMRPFAVSVFTWVLCVSLWPVWLAVYMWIHVLYIRGLCACAYCEYIVSLTTDWTLEHGAAAALPLLSCWIQHDALSPNKMFIKNIACLIQGIKWFRAKDVWIYINLQFFFPLIESNLIT